MPRQTLYQSPHPQLEPWPPADPPDLPFSDEPSRDVFRESCAAIAAALVPQGFKYLKSRQCCVRKGDECGNEIHFSTSHYNQSGFHVKLSMHAFVHSERLKAWRVERLPSDRWSSSVAGGMVHLLGTRFAAVQWELADPRDREATVADAVAFLHEEVLPYFAVFDDPAALVERLAVQALPGFELRPSVEFALCHAGRGPARKILARFVRERADLHDAIAQARIEGAGGRHAELGGYAGDVVYLENEHGLSGDA